MYVMSGVGSTQPTIHEMQRLQGHLILTQDGIEIHRNNIPGLDGRELSSKWASVREPTR